MDVDFVKAAALSPVDQGHPWILPDWSDKVRCDSIGDDDDEGE